MSKQRLKYETNLLIALHDDLPHLKAFQGLHKTPSRYWTDGESYILLFIKP